MLKPPSEPLDHCIVGGGAAGISLAKLLAQSQRHVCLIERHHEPGGSAGWFSRGFPRRTFDVGATQLVECFPGGLQYEVLSAQGAHTPKVAFDKISTLTISWPSEKACLELNQDGKILLKSGSFSSQDESQLKKLERLLRLAHSHSGVMWKVLRRIPRFPLRSKGDFVRALSLATSFPVWALFLFPFLLFTKVSHIMAVYRIKKEGFAGQIVEALLLDTTQNSPKGSPWLAGCMGLSLLTHGISRARGGMRPFFKEQLDHFKSDGGVYSPNTELLSVSTVEQGFIIRTVDTRLGVETESVVRNSLTLNLTLWDVLRVVPQDDPLWLTPEFKDWKKRTQEESGWGAFALFAYFEDPSHAPETPWYHLIFPHSDEPEWLQKSVYVSIPARRDPSNPPKGRTLTATVHVNARHLSAEERKEAVFFIKRRIESSLNIKLLGLENASPTTYARYTGRLNGQVGGFILSMRHFLWRAPPSFVRHPTTSAQLSVVGDTVFPGQGIVAATVSAIGAWERITGHTWSKQTLKTIKKN